MDKKDKTMEFSPINDRKEIVNRTENNIYSNARKSTYESKNNHSKKSSSDKAMLYVVIALAIAIIVALIAGAIIISNGNKANDITQDPIIVEDEPIAEEEEEEEPIPSENVYNIIFYGETVLNLSDGYEIAADVYDADFKKVGARKIKITDQTVIRESGKRMTPEGFIYTIESLAGEMISIEGKIREEDNFAISLSYDGSFREEMNSPAPENEETIENNEESELVPEENEEPTGETEVETE